MRKIYIILIILAILFASMLLIFIVIVDISNTNEEREGVCKKIGLKTELEYYSHGSGRCGWGERCLYQCRFIDKQGNIIVKNIQ